MEVVIIAELREIGDCPAVVGEDAVDPVKK